MHNKNEKPKNVAVFSQHESSFDPAHVERDPSTAKLCNFQLISPPRVPPPPPLINVNILPEDAPDDMRTIGNISDEVKHLKSIFEPLKGYITTCFRQCDCLNSSFLVPRAPYVSAASEGLASTTKFTSNSASWTEAEKLPSEPDAKTLLPEDLAEHGNWWTGSAHVGPGVTSTIFKKKPERASAASVSPKTPRIHWEELSEWYHVVLSAGCTWKGVLGKIEIKNSIGGIQKPYEMSAEEQQGIEQDLAHARDQVRCTLLEASESLLRRPGIPINEPQACRFLLLLLANPIFNPPEYPSPSGSRQGAYNMRNVGQISTSQGQQASPWKSTSIRQNLNAEGRSFHTDPGNANRHSSIIKRILGLISNLPVDCQHHITMWFSRFSKHHFEMTVELVGSFVSYRLSRQHGRKHSNRTNLVELIPEIQRSRVSDSAQLHVALGVSRNSKARDESRPTITYSEDWQIRAAARVMSLLFSANSSGPYRRQDDLESTSLEFSTADGCPSGPQHAHRPKQIVETSMFYNILLDHADLITDFETWETKTGKFTFCQYPMFLSIWAKIHLMGYDARRQMETKAREAFFNSIVSRKAVSQYLVLRIRRECLVEDSLRSVSEVVGTGQEEIKKGLRIEFSNEEGIDAGGYACPYQATTSFQC